MEAHDPGRSLRAIVLAAGESRRLGRPKQLVRWRGATLIEHAVRRAQEICPAGVIVVLGAHARAIEPVLTALAPQVVVNERWAEGLASSLRQGLDAVPSDCAGVLLLTCDQPRVSAADLRALVTRWIEHPDRAVAASYCCAVGVPAILPARLFDAARALDGDRGARALLVGEGERLEQVSLPDAAFDIDDEAALRALEAEDASGRRPGA
jgi:CTP:molybdopterin cytidylyltransferase MocA